MRLRRVLILAGIASLLGAILFGYAKMAEERLESPGLLDFAKFYVSAQSLQEGADIYRAVPVDHFGPLPEGVKPSRQHIHPNLNMPVVAVIFWPFALGGVSIGMAAWTMLSIGFVMAAAWLLGSQLAMSHGLSDFHRWMISGLLAVLMLVYFPTWASAALGQLSQLLLLVLCGAWLAARRKNDRLAGTLFAIALALKPFTGVFLLILPWLERWRLLRWYVGIFAALSLLGAVIAGPDSYLRYWSALQEVNCYASGWNASLMAPLSVLLGGGEVPGWFHYPRLAKPIAIASSLLCYTALVFQVRRMEDSITRLDMTVAGGIPLMLLASPLGWLYYFPLMWIAAVAVLGAVRPLASRWLWWLATALVLIVCGLPYPFVIGREAGESLRSLLITSADTAALLLAFAVILAAAWRVRQYPLRVEARPALTAPASA